jgi:hypothetical protein
MLSPSTPELYDISKELFECEMLEFALELGTASDNLSIYTTPKQLRDHIKIQKKEVFDKKRNNNSKMYKRESTICSEMFELPEARANLYKNVHIQDVANTDVFYQEVLAANKLDVPVDMAKRPDLPGSAGQPDARHATVRDAEASVVIEDVGHLKDKLTRTLHLPDVYSHFGRVLDEVNPHLETTRVLNESVKITEAINLGGFMEEVRYPSSLPSSVVVRKKTNPIGKLPPLQNRPSLFVKGNAMSPTKEIGGAPKTDSDSAIKPIQDATPEPSTERVDVNQLYDLYIYFLENGIEDKTRAKIKDILFYHGIYCPPETQKAIDLKELVEQVKQSYAEDDYKCEKCS